ncbi:MAG: helix-turn-helix domain-containing protein [Micrococcales bacterium]|nr:helix-turn-helix domain-containing protein [Micrococcales bacterium]
MRRNRRFSHYALRDARERAGWTRAQLGEQVGVSAATVKAWETGARAPKASTQLRVAQALGMGFEDLEQPGPAEAEDLRRLRETLGWTRGQAAGRLGIEPAVLARVEAGVELPPDPRRMARVYGVTAGELAAVWRRGGVRQGS